MVMPVEESKKLIGLLMLARERQLEYRALAWGLKSGTPEEIAAAKTAYVNADEEVCAIAPRLAGARECYIAMIESHSMFHGRRVQGIEVEYAKEPAGYTRVEIVGQSVTVDGKTVEFNAAVADLLDAVERLRGGS